MGETSKIEWTDATWNPVTGCTKVSPGCDNCYAEGIAERFRGGKAFPNGFDVTLREKRLNEPFKWREPKRVFVNSMSDLFHEAIPDEYLVDVFTVMAQTPQHTYQVLTKRHGRMRSFLNRATWPLPNVWVGVSVEDQKWADIRIPALLDTNAAVRFLSCEPLLGPVSIHANLLVGKWAEPPNGIDWVIVGGESGRGARPMRPEWARTLRDQCVSTGTAFFFKQWGSHDEHGKRMSTAAAGRLLDGRQWDEYPRIPSSEPVAS